MSTEKKVISIQAVKDLAAAGKNRKEIKAELGLTHGQMKALFAHDSLKGLSRNRVAGAMEIIDDTVEGSPVTNVSAEEVKTPAKPKVEGGAENTAAPAASNANAEGIVTAEAETVTSSPSPFGEQTTEQRESFS